MIDRDDERRVLFLLGAVNFINILDFMMVMPLGPDFARALHIRQERIGLVGGSYTAAAAVAGLVGSRFLDRFDRRSALAAAMLGLVTATALGGAARGLASLMAARMMAGAFGGPATSLAYSILADVVPAERRGRAIGAVMGASSVAAVLGVPTGLWLAQLGSWRTPFFSVAGLGVVVAGLATHTLPSMTAHIDPARRHEAPASATPLWRRPVVLISWSMSALIFFGNFAIIPYLSPYVQWNLGFPRKSLGVLYMAGGVVSFFAMRAVGWLSDCFGEVRVTVAGTLILEAVLVTGFILELPVPVVGLFMAFMLSSSFRGVTMNSVTSKVPMPWERARFTSIQSAVQHLSASSGAIVASFMLTSASETSPLVGVPHVATMTAALAAMLPFMLWNVRRRLPAQPAPR